MKKSILEFYSMAICFVAVVVFAITLGVGCYNLVEIANPELTMNSWDWERFSNNDAYFNNNSHLFYEKGIENPDRSKFPEKEITKMRENSLKIALQNERRTATQSLIRVLIFLIITSIIYMLHWKMAKKSRE